VLGLLRDLHLFVYRHIGDERLWATSMPCVLGGGASIPLARYGSSNAATMKTVYRRGLGNRYGRVMQIIAGVHFNFSVADALWPLLAGHRVPPAASWRAGLPLRPLHGHGAQPAAARLAGALPVRRLARGLQELRAGRRDGPESFDAKTSSTPTPPRCAWATSATRTARKKAPA
jgi:hypothetical protein